MKKYLPLLITVPFFLLLIRLFDRDFYSDEMYSLVHYILVPIRQTVWDYKNLNNHFLFSLLCNLYTKVIGCDLGTLMDKPFLIRIPLLIPTGITIIYLYRIGLKFFNEKTAVYSVVLLCSSLPYYYYATQVRGYSLSIMLFTMLSISFSVVLHRFFSTP